MSEKARITKPAAAIGCALALGTLLGACTSGTSSAAPPKNGAATVTSTSTGSVSTPTTSATNATGTPSTPAIASTPGDTAPAPTGPPGSQLLRPDQLPDATTYGWSLQDTSKVHVEEPLEPICGKPLGTELNTDAVQASYRSNYSPDFAEETIHTYASASYAASRVAASFPTCPGLTAHPANGFAWRTSGDSDFKGTTHVLFAVVGDKVAVLMLSVEHHDYDSSLDAQLLTTMTQRLQNP